jgi:rhodanese-related sulfurtransferase
VVLICRTGNRTDALARMLIEQAGYQQVYNVTHGITSWIAAGGNVNACTARGPDLRC